jgi:aldose 1-epimerase
MLKVLAFVTAALLLGTANSQFRPRAVAAPDANGKYTITARGIRAQFVPYGASISNLFVNDTKGIERDIVLGWDNATYYTLDTSHPHLGGVPGK